MVIKCHHPVVTHQADHPPLLPSSLPRVTTRPSLILPTSQSPEFHGAPLSSKSPTFCKRSVSRCVSFQAGGLPGTVLASTVSAQQLPSTVSRICRTSRRLSNCGIPTTLTTLTTLTTNQHQDKSDKCNHCQALLYLWNFDNTINMDNPCQRPNQY